jgi:hypothetical protein
MRLAFASLGAVLVAGAGYAGSSAHGRSRPSTITTPAAVEADLAAVRAAVDGSGILVPFRPARIGRRSCVIPRGGLAIARAHLIRGVCETHVRRRAGLRIVILQESWRARDSAGSGGRPFRQPDPRRRRLNTTWLLTVSPSGNVLAGRLRGDLPPQLVI